MQVVSSPKFQRSDIAAIAAGYRDSPTLSKVSKLGLLLEPLPILQSGLDDLVSWLVATRRLDIRVALVTDDPTGRTIYHEKLGVFEDGAGNYVAFSGSANESKAGLSENFEVVDVYRSWERSETRRAEKKKVDYAALWRSETPRLEVIPFPAAVRFGKIQSTEGGFAADSPESAGRKREQLAQVQINGLEETLGIPGDIALHKHQRKAVEEWFKNGGRGMLEMATGTGKTITALAIAAALYNAIGHPLLMVVVCPFLHLVYQWREEAIGFGLDPIPCAHGSNTWREEFSTRLYNAKIGQRRLTSLITTNATFAGEPFQKLLRSAALPLLLIADEVHNLGSSQLRATLPDCAQFRLGLSATPERWFDPQGTNALKDYFGDVVYSYTLAQGLEDKILCPYRYYPLLVTLTDSEMEQYYKMTVEIARLTGNGTIDRDDSLVEALLLRRARLIATAQNKLPVLRDRFTLLRGSSHTLVYCGDGTVESPVDDSITRQVDAVVRMLGRDNGMFVARYTAETELTRRSELRRNFASGVLQCLVAIRCLDEGVDIPETRRAFVLASSTNPRQFIQRRGRLLRTAPGKDFAEIFDFVVEPPLDVSGIDSPYFRITRNLFSRELDRISEFAALAVNGPEAMHHLLDVRKRLHLLDHV